MARLKQGRRKIQIAPITKNERRLVTLSKRRFGLFKKASELSTLCGVDLILIVFSPGNKVFSYGNPSVESIVDRYLGRYNPPRSYHVPTNQHNNVQINIPQVNYLNMQLNEVVRQLDVEKRHDQKERKKERQVMNWWEGPVENLTFNQLEQLKIGLEDVKSTVEKMKMEVSAAETLAAWPCISPHENALGHVANDIGAGSSSSMTPPGGYTLVNYGAGSSMVHNGFAPSSSFDEGQSSSSSSFNVMNDTVMGSAINPKEYLNLQGFGGSFF